MLATWTVLTPCSHSPTAIWLTTLLFPATSPVITNARRRTAVIRTRSPDTTSWSFASTA
jgi:hypothetical protein